MAKSATRPAIPPGSSAPFSQTRQAQPERWDTPFSKEMTEADVNLVLAHPLFVTTKPERFPPSIPLRGILQNDARIRRYLPGEIVVRQGDYGHSAFVILTGAVKILLKEPPAEKLGHRQEVRPSVWNSFKRWWQQPHFSEQAKPGGTPGFRPGQGGEARIFLQDVPGVLDADGSILLESGELFGEIAALGRTPRTATVVAANETLLLEIRWQGLREIRAHAPEWKKEIDHRYRERSLLRHLAETPLLWNLPEETLQLIADATRFETFGEFDWHSAYHRGHKDDERQRLEQEPVIAREGDYPNGLLLVRSGFARMSSRYNHGERTESYLGKGQAFGLREIVTGWRGKQHVPLRNSLRALGYVDLLFIPTAVLEQHVLPRLDAELLASLTLAAEPAPVKHGPSGDNFLEFIVAQRFINGRATMLIDMDRCTRCDDCVRACAATHDNNPRFIRQGPEASGVMVASACMHCIDPVCMIGCPTGAIYRGSIDGQVGINPDTCIGCSVCAQSCPYGTIQMVALHDEEGLPVVTEETGAPVRRATKCDLCVDQPGGPACVSACPHDALLRADMRQTDTLAAWSAKMSSFLTRRIVLTATTVVVAAGLWAAWKIGRVALRPSAIYSGWVLLGLLLGLTFFSARKKLPFFPLLKARHWLQAHIYFGWLACIVFVLHTGGRWPDGAIELPLALAFGFVAVSGVLGLWLSRWLPPRLTRSGESLVYERIPVLRHRLLAEVKEMVRAAEAETQSTTLGDFYVRVLAGYFAHVPALLAPLVGGDAEHHRARQELEALRHFLSVREIAIADQLSDLMEAKRNLDNQLAGQRLLKLWLFVHIPLTFVLLVFTAAHVWLALRYSHR